jgi:hypothetical protein
MGLPNNVRAAIAIKGHAHLKAVRLWELFDVRTFTSSSLDDELVLGVGSKKVSYAETKLLHLFARP